MSSKRIDSIIFDMDGTLVDWAGPISEAWNAIFAKYGWEKSITPADFASYAGHTTAEIGQLAFPNVLPDESFKRIAIASKEEVSYIVKLAGRKDTFVPGIDFLAFLAKEYQLFIVSNCMAGYIEAFYQIYGFGPYFIRHLDNRDGFPKWDNIKRLIYENKLSNPVYVGDTSMDQNACKLAGVPFIYAAYGYGHVDESQILGKLPSLSELPLLLKSI